MTYGFDSMNIVSSRAAKRMSLYQKYLNQCFYLNTFFEINKLYFKLQAVLFISMKKTESYWRNN